MYVPNRVWFDKDVSYDHLKVFGCKACVHVPKDERSKLDVKTKQCIFIGYGQDVFGYLFYDPIDKKLIRSRDVVFFEYQTIEDIDKTEKLDSRTNESLDVDPIPIIDTSSAHEGTQGNDQDNDESVEHIFVPTDDVVVDNQPTHVGIPLWMLQKPLVEDLLERSEAQHVILMMSIFYSLIWENLKVMTKSC